MRVNSAKTLGLSLVLAAAALASGVQAATLNTLASFTFATGDHPYAAVIFDNVVGRRSVLYTTAAGGGVGNCYEATRFGCGSVVNLTPPATPGGKWTLRVIRIFADPDGSVPYAGLIMDSWGALYGATTRGGGGANGCSFDEGCGIVFKLTPPTTPGGQWVETILHSFGDPPDGRSPSANLVFDTFGAIYGVTSAGGKFNTGVAYKLSPPAVPGGAWTETILHTFDGRDGQRPRANLVFDTHGALYGTTQFGGPYKQGVVFKLTPPTTQGGEWTETVIHAFDGSDGNQPFNSLLLDSTGAILGTTWKGGLHHDAGTVFKLSPPTTPGGAWTESVYQMLNGADGATMQGGIVMDTFGTLFGTTNRGGPGNCAKGDCGTIYRLQPPVGPSGTWTHTVLANFTGANGGNPEISPVFFQGALFGTGDFGGSANLGNIFQLTP